MLRIFGFLFLFISAASYGQTLTSARQGALNNYVEYANHSAEEMSALSSRIMNYYPEIKRAQTGRWNVRPFQCGDQLEEYYFNQAISKSGGLANAATLNARVTDLRNAANKLDGHCKELDTYYKLKDYEQDKYRRAYELINSMQKDLVAYRKTQAVLAAEVESTYRKLQPFAAGNPYHVVEQMMKDEIKRERALIDSWEFNLEEEVHTGWPVDKLQASIPETDKAFTAFSQNKFPVKYPASSMIGSFSEAVGSVLESKRSALDGYNFEAKKSDRHSNQVYMNLINYFDGTLVSDHNMFIQYASADGFYGLKVFSYVPLYAIRLQMETVNMDVKPFEDKARTAFKTMPQPNPVSKPVFRALSTYIEFINESLRQVSYLHNVLRNYNSSARYYKDLTTYKGKGQLTYDHAKFEIPLSIYQTLLAQSAAIPQAYRKSLTDQADVLLGILKEMDQLSIALAADANGRLYEKDNLKRAYEILERNALLFQIVDERKEQLYLDVRAVYESYAVANPAGSWNLSGKALIKLVDEDKVQLFKAKAFFKGDSSSVPTHEKVDQYLRDIIANEFTNMKGIERLGRFNGLCPYTPYEQLPANSRTFSEKISNIKIPRYVTHDGPYHEFVYLYNVIADDYNKFCELAKVDLLQTVRQPELYQVRPPEKPKQPDTEKRQDVTTVKPSDVTPEPVGAAVGLRVVHDTVKVMQVVHVDKQRTDTIYIEKHDTIYMSVPGEDALSMEGYAANNLVFLLDVSGSMNTGQKLPLLKKAMVGLLNRLRPEDQVSVVVYSGKAKVALQPTSAQQKDKIRKVIESLRSTGDTDGNAGIKLAYKVADGNYIRAGNNRIVLATDGEFPISEETMSLVSRSSGNDILLTVFNFGQSAQNLEGLASAGKGHYEFITRENVDSKLMREAKGKKKK